MPRIAVTYTRNGEQVEYSDLTLPHRAFDAHIRAGTVDGQPVTKLDAYRALRDATPANARALLDASPVSLIFGSWDSSRSSRQGRWRSALVGEIIGFCADTATSLRGGARVDPLGMRIELGESALKELAANQRAELSRGTYEKVNSEAKKAAGGKRVSASMLGLGGIPPSLEALAGVACERIIRSRVLSFATLRQIRFGAGPDGDVTCRALLAALALNALARSDAELYLRANCDLVHKQGAAKRVEIDRGSDRIALEPLSVAAADELVAQALAKAESVAGVRWNGVVMNVAGNPDIAAGSMDEEPDQ
jgi:CRISPR-associated protein Csb1